MKVAALRSSLLVCLLLLLTATSAEAAIFRGSTAQRERVTLRTDAEGVPTRLWFKKYRAGCGDGAFFRDRGSGFIRPFDRATSRKLVDSGPRYTFRDDGLKVSVLPSVRVRRVSRERWRGRFRSRVKVIRNGDVVDRCEADFPFAVNLRS